MSHAEVCNDMLKSGRGKDELGMTVKSGTGGPCGCWSVSSQSPSPRETRDALTCARKSNVRISQHQQLWSGDESRGCHWIQRLEQQVISRSGRKRRASCNMHAVGSCSHGCVRGDLDAQHAVGGEKSKKESGRRKEVRKVIGIREVLGSSVSDEVTFQAPSKPESAAIIVEAASGGTREAKRVLAPVKDKGRSGSEGFQVRIRR